MLRFCVVCVYTYMAYVIYVLCAVLCCVCVDQQWGRQSQETADEQMETLDMHARKIQSALQESGRRAVSKTTICVEDLIS